MRDLEIYLFLKYERSQGRPHPYIEQVWEKAKAHKQAHRETMYELCTLPKQHDPTTRAQLETRAEAYKLMVDNFYTHLRTKIEETLCIN